MTTSRISASILSADFARLGEEVQRVLSAGADLIHLDIMDNHYVPNLTFGPLVCSALRNYGIKAELDVHLMVQPVDELIIACARAGATTISFHPEASTHIDRSLQLIRELGCRAGLVFNPATPLHYLDHLLNRLDYILLMSVNPGFGGQAFISSALEKIKITRARIDASACQIELAVDGGVKADNIAQIAAAGAETFIVGSAIFSSADYAVAISELRAALAQAL